VTGLAAGAIATPARARPRAVRALIAAETLSGLGTQMTLVALPWFVLATSHSATKTSAVLAAELVPVALLGLPGGSLASRLGARTTMRAADLSRAGLVALVPLLQHLGALSFGLLMAIVFAIGCFTAPYLASQRVVLPEIVGDDEHAVARANSLVEAATRIAAFAGPAAAGMLIAVVGAIDVLWLDAGSYVASFLLLGFLPSSRRRARTADDRPGVLTGVRHVARDQLLGRLFVASLLYGFLFPVLIAALPLVTYARYGGDAVTAGWLYASWGAGSIAGSALAFRLAGSVEPLRLGALAAVAAALPLWPLALELPAAGVAAMMLASGVCIPLINTSYWTVITLHTPAELRAHVLSALVTANLLAGAVGYALAGPAFDYAGFGAVFLVIAGAGSACAVLLVRVARLERRPALANDGQVG